MKENERLLKKLQERLTKEFKNSIESNSISFYNQDLEKDEWGYEILKGHILHLNEVYRHNATDENKSCEIRIIKWNNNCGSNVARFKVNCQWTEKRIEKEVLKALETYKNLESEEI